MNLSSKFFVGLQCHFTIKSNKMLAWVVRVAWFFNCLIESKNPFAHM